MDELDSPYPFILSLPQSETERILERRLSSFGVQVEREKTLIGLEVRDDAVAALVKAGNGEERIDAHYVVGCDGAHSSVRRLLEIGFQGPDLDGNFGLADVHFRPSLPRDEATAFFAPDGVILCIPLPGPDCWRVIATLPNASEQPPSLEWFEETMRKRTHLKPGLYDPLWLATYSVRQRKVERYRVGRVFLVGDAAHAHSPVGGQGMNTGLQDAHNLGWKLALVARKAGRPDLLESYQAEREPIARALLNNTERATRTITLRNPVGRELRNVVARFLSSLDVVQQRLARTLGELDLDYRRSPAVEEDRESVLDVKWTHDASRESASISDIRGFASAPRAGDRAPDVIFGSEENPKRLFQLLRGTRHVLLLFDGHGSNDERYRNLAAIAERAAARFKATIDAHIVVKSDSSPEELGQAHSILLDPQGDLHRRYGAGAECQYLIRPDGYIGYRSQPSDWEKLESYLSKWVY
jgi:2-polyprenyl-6-methoxyphenol hydroxylase-like FAD-dependent oxidoreductase